MRRIVLIAVSAVVAFAGWGVVQAEPLDEAAFKRLTDRFPFAIRVGSVEKGNLRFVYPDQSNHVHVYKLDRDRLVQDWEATGIGSRITTLFVSDLYGDGSLKLVIATAAGRILVYDMDSYDLDWENLQDPFDRVDFMVGENLDDDVQQELVFIADGVLYIYDGLNKTKQWNSQTKFDAGEIAIANVDDDKQPEIILNTGVIIDSRFYNVDFQTDTKFGDRITLMDLNGDGFPEIFGEMLDFNLKVFDVYAEREIW